MLLILIVSNFDIINLIIFYDFYTLKSALLKYYWNFVQTFELKNIWSWIRVSIKVDISLYQRLRDKVYMSVASQTLNQVTRIWYTIVAKYKSQKCT